MSSNSKAIPLPSRRAEPGTPIPLDYGTTPGGTIYSSTPGGKPPILLSILLVSRTLSTTSSHRSWDLSGWRYLAHDDFFLPWLRPIQPRVPSPHLFSEGLPGGTGQVGMNQFYQIRSVIRSILFSSNMDVSQTMASPRFPVPHPFSEWWWVQGNRFWNNRTESYVMVLSVSFPLRVKNKCFQTIKARMDLDSLCFVFWVLCFVVFWGHTFFLFLCALFIYHTNVSATS